MASTKMIISLDLGNDRQLHVNEDNEVFIKDMTTMRCAYFTGPRWTRFVALIPEIDTYVQMASIGKATSYRHHVGGKWFVSVDDKYPTVDVRRWYLDTKKDNRVKPSRVGIALTFRNWDKLKDAIAELNDEVPTLLAISPCWHNSQIDLMCCDECTPFTEHDDDLVKAAAAAVAQSS